VPGITVRRLALPSGPSLRVLEAGPDDGPVVVLVHGWAVSVYLWRHNILPLAAAGNRVVAFDLPGHGLSDAPQDAGRYTLAAFTATLHEFLDTLGIPRCAIVAQSMGGKVAVRFALDEPARVSSLQLYGPVGFGLIPPWQALAPLLPDIPGDLPSRLVPRRLVEFVQHRVYGKLGWFTARDVDEYWAPTQFPDVVRAQLRMLKEFAWAPWEPAELARLAVRTQVVFGTRDRTVRPVHAERLSAALAQGRLVWIEDGGHVVMEEAPERVNAMIVEALRD
jgi:epoxide hydrolase 4